VIEYVVMLVLLVSRPWFGATFYRQYIHHPVSMTDVASMIRIENIMDAAFDGLLIQVRI